MCAVVSNCQGAVVIGNYSLIGIGAIVIGPVRIGNDVMIGQHVLVTAVQHGYENVGMLIREQPLERNQVVIDDNVWIGANSVITDGVRIGSHVVVGAGSLVTKDVQPFTMVAGNPARVIKRYDMSDKKWVRC